MQKILHLEIPGRLPSWNQLLGMNHWQRHKLKADIAKDFLSALRASGNDSSMKTTLQKSSTWIFADTLESYLEMKRIKRASKRASAKPKKARKSAR